MSLIQLPYCPALDPFGRCCQRRWHGDDGPCHFPDTGLAPSPQRLTRLRTTPVSSW